MTLFETIQLIDLPQGIIHLSDGDYEELTEDHRVRPVGFDLPVCGRQLSFFTAYGILRIEKFKPALPTDTDIDLAFAALTNS